MKASFSTIPILVVIAYFLPSLSFEAIGLTIDQSIFKGLGFCFVSLGFVWLAAIKKNRIKRSDLLLLSPIWFFFFSFFISEAFFGSVGGAFIAFARFVAVVLFSSTLFLLDVESLVRVKKFSLQFVFILSAISLIMFILRLPGGERFASTGFYSNKSLVFEQNVFGIAVYISFIVLIGAPKKIISKIAALLAIAFSFYRTVYILSMIRVMVLRKEFTILGFAIGGFAFLYYYDVVYTTLKLDQASSLTGRDVLWAIAFEGFLQSPFWGNAESTIPAFSNSFLNRDPAFTTFHNMFFDILYINGMFGLFLFLMSVLVYFYMFGRKHFYFAGFLMLPALFNTYYPFSLNILGGLVGVLAIYHHRTKALPRM
ncbi:hypothetical protein [Thalassolituus sp.]|jgi:O-antigen ligase|uniref:hypothetical protein n=1 Tax=Thalassolituus sp. TaxID=2030822 RepID=UPI002A80EF5C|nr:hypothetical protein [Thalassolituus sp.]